MRDADNGLEHEVGPGPLAALWRYRTASLVIVVLIAVVGAAGGVLTRGDPTATTRIGLANPRSLSLFLGGGSSGADLGRYAAAQVKFIEGNELLEATSTLLGGHPTVDTLRSALSVAASSTADVITVTASAKSTGEADRRANGVVAAYQQLTLAQGAAAVVRTLAGVDLERTRLTAQIAATPTTTAAGRAVIAAATDQLRLLAQTASDAQTQAALFSSGTVFVDSAVATEKKTAASAAARDGVLGALVGLLLAGAVGWIRSGRRREVDTPEDAAYLLGAPLLGQVPTVQRRQRRALLDDPAHPPLPAYHGIATALGAVSPRGLFLVVGPARQDGRTVTALGLANAVAAGGARVALVDADLRTARLSRLFGLDPDRGGLAEVATGDADVLSAAAVVAAPDGGELSVIGAGRPVTEPAGLLRRTEVGEALRKLRAAFEVVIVDTPATVVTADALALARNASGVLAVVRRHTPARPVTETRERIGVNGVPLLGVIFTFAAGRNGGYRNARAPRSRSRARHLPVDPYPVEAPVDVLSTRP